MEIKVCKGQGKTINSASFFQLNSVSSLCSGAGFCVLRYFCDREHIAEDFWDWTEVWQKYVLNSASLTGFPSQNGFSGTCAATIFFFFCIVDTIVLHVAFSACYVASEEELESDIVQRFISCWDTDPAPGPYWSLAIFTAVTSWCHSRAGWEMHSLSNK